MNQQKSKKYSTEFSANVDSFRLQSWEQSTVFALYQQVSLDHQTWEQ